MTWWIYGILTWWAHGFFYIWWIYGIFIYGWYMGFWHGGGLTEFSHMVDLWDFHIWLIYGILTWWWAHRIFTYGGSLGFSLMVDLQDSDMVSSWDFHIWWIYEILTWWWTHGILIYDVWWRVLMEMQCQATGLQRQGFCMTERVGMDPGHTCWDRFGLIYIGMLYKHVILICHMPPCSWGLSPSIHDYLEWHVY